LRELLIDELLTKEEYSEELRKIQEEIIGLHINSSGHSSIENAMQAVFNAGNAFQSASPELRKKAMQELKSNLIWDEKNLYISAPKWLNILLDGLRKARLQNSQFEPEKDIDFTGQAGDFSVVFLTLCSTLEDVRNSFINDNN
jgi:hypothetical protein